MASDEEMQSINAGFVDRILQIEENPLSEFIPLEDLQSLQVMPLNIIIQKLTGLVRSISQDFSIAKERASKQSTDNLNTDESTAIYLYTMGKTSNAPPLYECLNEILRSKDQGIKNPYLPFLKLLITALLKIEPITLTVMRGVKADFSEKYSVGKTFVWSTFSSCALNGKTLFSNPIFDTPGPRTVFRIHCSNARNIRNYSALSIEDEYILLPGTKFKVISILTPSTDLHIIEIQEIVSSNLLRQRSPSISNPINTYSYIEGHSEKNDIHLINAYNHSKTLNEKLNEQREQTEGNFSLLNINDEQIVLIANEVKTNSNWKILKLNSNKIDGTGLGLTDLSAALVLNTTLESLSLDDNFISDYGIRLLIDALQQNYTLVSLTLTHNDIRQAGASYLAELLRTNTTLIELSLDENNIDNNGMHNICEALEQYNRTLRKFSIKNNNISDKSVDAILGVYAMNYVLKEFEYNINPFSERARETLINAEKQHQQMYQSLLNITQVAVLYLELKNLPEKRLSRDASLTLTNFRRLINPTALENCSKRQTTNEPIYLILTCEDDKTIKLISSFCQQKKMSLFILQTISETTNKKSHIFKCEDSLMFRVLTCIANQYRTCADQAMKKQDKETASIYFQQAIDVQQKLVNYLKKRREILFTNQNETPTMHKVNPHPDIHTSKSLIIDVDTEM